MDIPLSVIPFPDAAGTFFVEARTPASAIQATIARFDNGTADEQILIEYTGTNVQCVFASGGVILATLDLGAMAVDTPVDVTIAWAVDDICASLNGGTIETGTDTSGELPTVDTLVLAEDLSPSAYGRAIYVPRRVANEAVPPWRHPRSPRGAPARR